MPHEFPGNLEIDATFGYTVEQMLTLQPPPEPAGFEAFWRDTYAQTLAEPLHLESFDIESRNDRFSARELHFTGFEKYRLGGWLTAPLDREPERFAVVGHGYYDKPFADCTYERNTAQLFITCRGMGLSASNTIPKETAQHVLHGIESKETYVHRGCIADTWTAASALLQIYPQAAGKVEYRGASFGGGIGAAALPWDDRFVFAGLGVPSFGNYPLRVMLDCTGSGGIVRRRWLEHPAVLDVLAYFDSAVHGARIKIAAHVSCAAYDPSVPPPGQFTVYNAIQSPKKLYVQKAGHFDWPGSLEDDALAGIDRETFRRSVMR